MSGKKWLLRAAGICGITASVVVLLGILAALSMSPNFNWSVNYLSDLGGNWGTSGANTAFNSGLIIGGILAIIFAVGLLVSQKGVLGRAGSVLFFIDAIALLGIGVFPMTAANIFSQPHFYVSMTFFGMFPISAFVLGASAIKAKSLKFGLLTILLGIVAVLPWPVTMAIYAIPEAIAAVPVLVWCVIQGVMLYRSAPSK
jgi:hypothetical membrane protein